jgi:integrase
MQRGTILKHHGSWVLRYYDTELTEGRRVRKKAFHKLAPVGPDYPTKRSVLLLAEKILQPINSGQLQPESAMLVTAFIEDVYLPFVKEMLRPSTYKDYRKDVYERHLKARLGDLRIRDFRTVQGQRLIATISKDNPDIGHKTLMRVKSFLSGTFKHAKREGIVDAENPMRDVSVPGRPKKFKGATYTVEELYKIGTQLEGVAFAAVMTAAFSGLRLAELRGLRWEDYDGESLAVKRTVWRTRVGETKNPESEGSVPVLPILQRILNEHKTKVSGKNEEWIFRGEKRGTSLNLANLVRRGIQPMLRRCTVCKRMESRHEKDHAFELDASIPEWRGWHAFRRSLASNLYELGVKPKVIQAILRHADIGTTLSYYVSTPDAESREALKQLDEWFSGAEPAEWKVMTAREYESIDQKEVSLVVTNKS